MNESIKQLLSISNVTVAAKPVYRGSDQQQASGVPATRLDPTATRVPTVPEHMTPIIEARITQERPVDTLGLHATPAWPVDTVGFNGPPEWPVDTVGVGPPECIGVFKWFYSAVLQHRYLSLGFIVMPMLTTCKR